MSALGRVSRDPYISLTSLRQIEGTLGFDLPAAYRDVVTTCEPEMANFYFKGPERHAGHSHLIVFASWGEDLFAFDTKDNFRIRTIIGNEPAGKEWPEFRDWLAYVWGMSNRPINPE